jgi:hypothetical protein
LNAAAQAADGKYECQTMAVTRTRTSARGALRAGARIHLGVSYYRGPVRVPRFLTFGQAKELFDRDHRIYMVPRGTLLTPEALYDPAVARYSYSWADWFRRVDHGDLLRTRLRRLWEVWQTVLKDAKNRGGKKYKVDFYIYVDPEIQMVAADTPVAGHRYELRRSVERNCYFFNNYAGVGYDYDADGDIVPGELFGGLAL